MCYNLFYQATKDVGSAHDNRDMVVVLACFDGAAPSCPWRIAKRMQKSTTIKHKHGATRQRRKIR